MYKCIIDYFITISNINFLNTNFALRYINNFRTPELYNFSYDIFK